MLICKLNNKYRTLTLEKVPDKKKRGEQAASKQQNRLNIISETGKLNHLPQTIELVTDGTLSLVISKFKKAA